MNNVRITLYHPTIELLSDRTLRFLLKKMSTLVREIQTREVIYLVNSNNDLSESQKQSIRDRLKEPLKHITAAYYVERIERGSLEIVVSISLFSIWLLDKTIGESIKDAWLASKLHQMIVDYLSSDSRQTFVQDDTRHVITNVNLGRFYVEEYKQLVYDDKDIGIQIRLNTSPEIEEHIQIMTKVDTAFVINDAKKQIADLNKKIKNTKSKKRPSNKN